MLGTTTYSHTDLPYETSNRYANLSEDEQFAIIDRAINGDLKGSIPITEEDMELYNRRKSQESYANEYRKATEFSYVPRHKQAQVKAERAKAMGLTNPSPIPIQQPQQQYQGYQNGNPVLNGYQTFNSPIIPPSPINSYNYPNTYYNTGYQNSYNGGLYNTGYRNSYYQPYQPYQPIMLNDPVLSFAINSMTQDMNMGPSYYYQYPYMQQQRSQQFTINCNQKPSQFVVDYANSIQSNNVQPQPEYKYPEGFDSEEPVVISMAPWLRQRVMSRMNNRYTMTEEYRKYISQQNQEQRDNYTSIIKAALGEETYENIVTKQKEMSDKLAMESYKRRRAYEGHFDDPDMTPAQRELKADELRNMQIVYNNFRYNPYNICYKLSDGWKIIQARINSDKTVQKIKSFFNPNSNIFEFLNEEYPRFERQKKLEQFCHDARMDSLSYDADKYRNALMRSGISSTPYLGFRQTYDPITNSNVTVASAPQSISDRYNARRDSYIREAEKRGGVV